MDINESQEERIKTSLIYFIKTQMYWQRYIPNPVKTSKMETFLKIATKVPS